jgi:hypothetical protein
LIYPGAAERRFNLYHQMACTATPD